MSTGGSNPRLSINQLANYLVATPTQRRRILTDAKNPATFRVNWYDFARGAMTLFITRGMTDESILTSESTRLYGLAGANDYEDTRNRTNAEAIDAFLDCYDQIDDAGMSISIAPTTSQPIVFHGVEISVRPEFTISGVYRGSNTAGGIKLYFSKGDPLTADSAPYVTAALMQHIQQHHQPSGYTTRHASCQVVDVFARNVHAAPRAIARRFTNIDAACQEIALLWPSI